MVEITINCPAIEKLAQAIENLAGVMNKGTAGTAEQPIQPTQNAVAPNIPPQNMTTPTIPPTDSATPLLSSPTNDLTYTLDQLAVAAAPLMSAGKQKLLTEMLKEFRVVSLTELPPEQYPAVAQRLRDLGAKI